jgi:hypothetical protein
MIVRRFDVLSVTKVGGALYAAMGLVIGAVISLVALAGAALSPSSSGGGQRFFGLLFGVGAVVLLPVFYGILGAITSGLGALLYNAIAKYIGGISVELAPEPPPLQPPTPPAVAA